MAVSPVLLKGIAGLGVVSVATTGVVFRKEIFGTTVKNINYLEKLGLPPDCDLSSRSCQLTNDDLNKLRFIFGSSIKGRPTIASSAETNSVADLTWETTGRPGSIYEFTFTLKAKTNPIDLGSSLSSINIPTDGMKFKLEEEINTSNEEEYYLQLKQSNKELIAGMSCKNGDCTRLNSETNINGLDNDYTITKKISEETTRYPDWYKYKVTNSSSSTNDTNGYYKLEFDNESKKWKLIKVDDLLSKWDESILEKGKWSAVSESNKIKVTVNETNREINGDNPGKKWTWECEITGKNNPSSTSLEGQLNDLKAKLGIESLSNAQNIEDQKRKFVENCARNRSEEQKQNVSKESLTNPQDKIQSTITLATEGSDGNTKFKSDDFLKLFNSKVTNASS